MNKFFKVFILLVLLSTQAFRVEAASTESEDLMVGVPEEIIVHILSFISAQHFTANDFQALSIVAQVNQDFKRIAEDNSLWKVSFTEEQKEKMRNEGKSFKAEAVDITKKKIEELKEYNRLYSRNKFSMMKCRMFGFEPDFL